jgi:TRAP-type C4-dicarboxylate transport system substrate-binding protein
MISELGKRHVARLRECLAAFEAGVSSLPHLIADAESLIAALDQEADEEWLAELQAESNRLEFVNSAGQVGRNLTPEEKAEVSDAVSQLRLMTEPYQ